METVHGFYRYTDIIFEWHKALPDQSDARPLRALLTCEALVDSGHPLHKPDTDGVELYKGFFRPHGEMRLLFSSAQVEYMRHWLYEIGLTKERLPIPCGADLIQRSDMCTVSPVVYSDAKELKSSIHFMEKKNREIRKGGNSPSNENRLKYEKVRSFWAEKMGTWLAVDFEAWEDNQKILTEFGWSLVRWKNDGTRVSETGHWIVEEHKRFVNHKYVTGHRDNYDFGKSEDIKLNTWKSRIVELISRYKEQGPLLLVFHDASLDVSVLRKDIGVCTDDWKGDLPDMTPDTGVYVLDTTALYATMNGTSIKKKTALKDICARFQIPIQHMHNAGNDAHYTLLVAEAMATARNMRPAATQNHGKKRSRED